MGQEPNDRGVRVLHIGIFVRSPSLRFVREASTLFLLHTVRVRGARRFGLSYFSFANTVRYSWSVFKRKRKSCFFRVIYN